MIDLSTALQAVSLLLTAINISIQLYDLWRIHLREK